LKALTQKFFLDYPTLKYNTVKLNARYQKFMQEFSAMTKTNKSLDIRRGYIRPLLHFALTFAAGIGVVTAMLDYGMLYATGKPLFGSTTKSRKSSDELVNILKTDFLP